MIILFHSNGTAYRPGALENDMGRAETPKLAQAMEGAEGARSAVQPFVSALSHKEELRSSPLCHALGSAILLSMGTANVHQSL